MYRVMIADDEPLMRKAMVALTNWGELECEVVYIAENGRQVVEHLEEVRPDILITDIKMPGKDGIEIAKYIWEQKLPVKVILLTAYADFSYAQAAVKYNVVDYVTKTGAFDSLITAISKAKELIKTEREKRAASGGETAVEYFLKSVFDSSIYDEEEIREGVQKLGLCLDNYLVLVLHFRLNDEMSNEKRTRTYKSLFNFYSMIFGEQILRGIPMQRDLYAIVLNKIEEPYIDKLRQQSRQIADMMDNFMGLFVNIGISLRQNEITQLKPAYLQAESALGNSFTQSSNKISFYGYEEMRQDKYNPKLDIKMEDICYYAGQGDEENALRLFGEVLEEQKKELYTANTIKSTGLIIQQKLRKILGQYGGDIYQVTGYTESITEKIQRSFYVEEYGSLLEDIIRKTARYVEVSVSHKNTLVSGCEKFIEENYDKGISVTDIANHMGTSISYLSRTFKDATGEKLINTLNRKRIEKAKDYLKNSDKKIYEIADALGFENATYFSYFFKKYTGVSPKDYK